MKVYLSHKISGGKEAAIPYTEKQKNCRLAVKVAKQITDALPSIELYVPGGQTEQFVHLAYVKKYLTVQQILDIDCGIIDTCDAVIIYIPVGDKLDGGRAIEREHAIATSKPVCVFSHEREAIKWLTDMIVRA